MNPFYINPWQYKRLFTLEDAHFFHAHKIMGCLVLGNFSYRWYLWMKYGSMYLDGSRYTLAWILIHSFLHITSFQFHLPSRRNKAYNIIWPEMRWHTMIFAYRSIVCMLFFWLYYNNMISLTFLMLIRPFLVFGTILSADYVTYYYKSQGLVHEQDSTMRGNPYPSDISPIVKKYTNYFYSISQVFATLIILNSKNIEAVFLILLPIQTAPFGMTLVKKGIINQGGWHISYIAALLSNYIHAIYRHQTSTLTTNEMMIIITIFAILRFKYNMNKYYLWFMISIYYYYILHLDSSFRLSI